MLDIKGLFFIISCGFLLFCFSATLKWDDDPVLSQCFQSAGDKAASKRVGLISTSRPPETAPTPFQPPTLVFSFLFSISLHPTPAAGWINSLRWRRAFVPAGAWRPLLSAALSFHAGISGRRLQQRCKLASGGAVVRRRSGEGSHSAFYFIISLHHHR